MKKLIWIIVIVLVIAGIWWLMSSKQAVAPTAPTADTTQPTTSADSQASISQDLQGLNSTDLNTEFQAIDKDQKSL